MTDFLSGSFFRYLLLPIATIIVAIFFKAITKRDIDRFITIYDLNVGTNLIVTSIFILLTKASIVALKIKNDSSLTEIGSDLIMKILVSIILMLLFAVLILNYVRRNGWEDFRRSYPTIGVGILLPFFVGVAYLFIAYSISIDTVE